MTPGLILSFSVLAATAFLAAAAIGTTVLVVRLGTRRSEEMLPGGSSRLVTPLSVVVPAISSGELQTAIATVTASRYPELEIVAVLHGGRDDGFDALAERLRLDAREFFYKQSIPTAPVERIYRSSTDPRLTVLCMTSGTRVDALNCAMSFARFRYAAVVEPGVIFDADALTRLMAAPLRDPAAVLGAASHVDGTGLRDRLATARAAMETRVFWRHRPRALAGGSLTYIWRRDVVVEAGGFSAGAADPQADLVVRAVAAHAAQGAPARFVRYADVFGVATRRPRAGGAWAALQLMTPAVVKAFGLPAVIWQVGAQLLVPAAETWAVLGGVVAWSVGQLSLPALVSTLAIVVLARAVVTAAALMLHGFSRGGRAERALVGALAAAPLEIAGRMLPGARPAAFSQR